MKLPYDDKYIQNLYDYIDEMLTSEIDEDAWVEWLQEDYGLTKLTAREVIGNWKELQGKEGKDGQRTG